MGLASIRFGDKKGKVAKVLTITFACPFTFYLFSWIKQSGLLRYTDVSFRGEAWLRCQIVHLSLPYDEIFSHWSGTCIYPEVLSPEADVGQSAPLCIPMDILGQAIHCKI